MSREILFRGKRLNNGEWVYGDLRHRGNKVAIDGDIKISKSLAREIRPLHSTKSTQKIMREIFPVDPATVGQYTGLVDKNGKKIFEGDIVEGYDFNAEDGYGVVQWNEGAFEVVGHDLVGSFHENYWGKGFEVIGSIHDNPELLKEEMS